MCQSNVLDDKWIPLVLYHNQELLMSALPPPRLEHATTTLASRVQLEHLYSLPVVQRTHFPRKSERLDRTCGDYEYTKYVDGATAYDFCRVSCPIPFFHPPQTNSVSKLHHKL